MRSEDYCHCIMGIHDEILHFEMQRLCNKLDVQMSVCMYLCVGVRGGQDLQHTLQKFKGSMA